MLLLFTLIRAAIRTLFMTKQALALENLALRQQLAAYRRTCERARLRRWDRVFWVGLSRLWDGWPLALVIVKPATVIRWRCHRSLEMDCPEPRAVQPPEVGELVEVVEAGGLFRHYERVAA